MSRRALAVGLALFLLAPGPALAQATGGGSADRPSDPPTGLRPGDEVRDGRISLRVPPKGQRVWKHETYPDGTQVLGITTEPDGKVAVHNYGDESAKPAGEDGQKSSAAVAVDDPFPDSLPSCSNPHNDPKDGKWYSRVDWYLNIDTIPLGEVQEDNAIQAFRDGITNIVRGDNPCGYPDQIDATSLYFGDTNYSSGVSFGSGCTWDGRNVADFKMASGSPATGGACTRQILYGVWTIVEGDITLNDARVWTANPIPGQCSGKSDVESTVTHERGHNFGLNDLAATADKNLTMSAGALSCATYKRDLGLGDVVGLQDKYS